MKQYAHRFYWPPSERLSPFQPLVRSFPLMPRRRRKRSRPSSDPAAFAQSEIDKGVAYLKSQQLPDGSWEKEGEPPALTAIALRVLIGDPKSVDQPFVQKGFDKLLTFQKDDGSISSDILATYNTAIATSAFAKANNPNTSRPSIKPSRISRASSGPTRSKAFPALSTRSIPRTPTTADGVTDTARPKAGPI